jgi:hypothetical protein
MKQQSSLDWQDLIDTGCQYLKTARNGLQRPSVFNNELIYQLTAMAVEKLLVGVYQYHQKMPFDHTLEGLVDDLASICFLDKELGESIKGLGRFDNMCPLVPVQRSMPSDMQIRAMLAVGGQVADFAAQQISSVASHRY